MRKTWPGVESTNFKFIFFRLTIDAASLGQTQMADDSFQFIDYT